MIARVFIKHGSMVARVVSIHSTGRYYGGTYLPETGKVLPDESGRMLKSPEDTAAALFGMGYGEAPLALDPHIWLKSSTPGEATQVGTK